MARYGMVVCEMQEQPGASATTSDAVDEPLSEAPAAAPSIEVSTPEVLTTEEEVVFSTTAAVAPQSQWAGNGLLAGLWRALAGWTNASTPASVLPAVLPRARPPVPRNRPLMS